MKNQREEIEREAVEASKYVEQKRRDVKAVKLRLKEGKRAEKEAKERVKKMNSHRGLNVGFWRISIDRKHTTPSLTSF